ncbi:CPBP family intramembrane glutamic endopeptidase [Pseudactinotalea sp. Z1739]|uniref:CPBP family intramembrane glutamic endopeptidase n=1 Tax=Pseudactinotalea sp. Z1739 TaxID=3413028 RepID=UPI003C7D656F
MRRPSGQIALFVVLSFALAWAVAAPLWLGDGLADRRFGLIAMAMMFTPTVAALVVVLLIGRPTRILYALGIWPLGRPGRFIGYLALAIVVPTALCLVALPVGAWLGVYPADFANLSAFAQVLEQQGVPDMGIPIQALAALQLINIVVAAFLNLIPALGEEIGWRGWLLPKLMPLGPLGAIAVSGVIWGVWHAPLILLGYNYPLAPGWLGVAMMTGMCILIGGVFGWLRLRSDSVWPAALAHGAFNAAAGSFVIFAMAGETVDTVHASILGWSGWIAPALLLALIVGAGKFRLRPNPAVVAADAGLSAGQVGPSEEVTDVVAAGSGQPGTAQTGPGQPGTAQPGTAHGHGPTTAHDGDSGPTASRP